MIPRILLCVLPLCGSVSGEIILVDPDDSRDLTLVVGSNLMVNLKSFENGQSSINLSGDGFPSFASTDDLFDVIAFSQGASVSDAFDNEGVFYAAADGFKAGAALGLNYARVDVDGEFDDEGNLTFELVLEFDTKGTLGGQDDVITRYAYRDVGDSLDVPEAFSLFWPSDIGVNFSEISIISLTPNQENGLSLVWGSIFPMSRTFTLWSTTDPGLPIDQWSQISGNLDYVGPNRLNTYEIEMVDFMSGPRFYAIRSEN